MEIHLEHEAEKYIMQKGQVAMVILGSMSGCCGGSAPIPKIELSSPKDLSKYDEKKIGEIVLFVDKELTNIKEIHITFARLLWAKKLSVEITE